MRMPYFLVVSFLIFSCTNEQSNPENKQHIDPDLPLPENFIQAKVNYLENQDFDQDGQSDYLSFTYTGGAHCCYQMHLKLSSKEDTIHYPFEMDGGLGFGIIKGGVHDQFYIDDFDKDSQLEIFMGIYTYNGQKSPIDPKWTEKYGITSNYIIFDYYENDISLMDFNPEIHQIK